MQRYRALLQILIAVCKDVGLFWVGWLERGIQLKTPKREG